MDKIPKIKASDLDKLYNDSIEEAVYLARKSFEGLPPPWHPNSAPSEVDVRKTFNQLYKLVRKCVITGKWNGYTRTETGCLFIVISWQDEYLDMTVGMNRDVHNTFWPKLKG